MLRKIIKIDEEKCIGCGACADACLEGAIKMIGGKAKLTREDYCDGLGNCLPACPADAISFEEREAPAFDAAAVEKPKKANAAVNEQRAEPLACGCPGTQSRRLERKAASISPKTASDIPGMLSQWPVQIKLVPVNAPYFDGADLLVAADCAAFAYGNFHRDFIDGRITLIGCPKLDGVDYAEKLGQIIAQNDIRSVTVARMEVPCCGGIENAVKAALMASGKFIPWRVAVISTEGNIIRS
ncbi:MAG: 4Fe-4S binding protein [Eubacteriales bacterium]